MIRCNATTGGTIRRRSPCAVTSSPTSGTPSRNPTPRDCNSKPPCKCFWQHRRYRSVSPVLPERSRGLVDLGAGVDELDGLLLHPELDRLPVPHAVFLGVLADVLRDLHRAELRSAHG